MKPICSKKTFDVINTVQQAVIIGCVIFALCFMFGVSYVPSKSMFPTLDVGNILIYRFISPDNLDYSDIVTFVPTNDKTLNINNGAELFYHTKIIHNQELEQPGVFVKRIVGFGGDVIEVHDGYLWRNGEKQIEYYVNDSTDGEFGPYTVPDGYIFCMGDNRNNSTDSRILGAFPENVVLGKMIFSISNLF